MRGDPAPVLGQPGLAERVRRRRDRASAELSTQILNSSEISQYWKATSAGCTGRYPPPPDRLQTRSLLPAVDPFEHGSVREVLELDHFAAAVGQYIGYGRGFSASGDLAEDDHNILFGEETAGRCCEGLLR